jgi:hypothetical protein
MDPQFRIDGVSDGVLLAMEWASNCVFRLFERVCDVAAIWIIIDSDDVDGSHVFKRLNRASRALRVKGWVRSMAPLPNKYH